MPVRVQEIAQHYLHISYPSRGIVRLIHTKALRLPFRRNDSKCSAGDKNVNYFNVYDYTSRDPITVSDLLCFYSVNCNFVRTVRYMLGYMYIFDTRLLVQKFPRPGKMVTKEGDRFLLLVFYTMFFMDLYTPARSKEDCTNLTCSSNNCSEWHNVDHSTVNSYLSAFYYL